MSTPSLNSFYFEDLSPGMRETLSKTVTSEDIVAFANISGDQNPLHLSDDYAANTPFGKRIAHGMLTAGLISAILGTRLPGPGSIYLSQSLKFKAPVYVDDLVETMVEIIDLDERKARAIFKCQCCVGETIVLEGEATIMVPRRGS